jgi:hypothetical protein
VQVVNDILEAGMNTNLFHDLFSSNCKMGMSITTIDGQRKSSLNPTPMRVKMINWEITRKAK